MKSAYPVALALVLALSACGEESFAERDPKGYEACSEWARYKSEGGVAAILGGGAEVAKVARGASSKAIRESVSNLFDEETIDDVDQQFGLIDAEKLEAACTDEGFEFD